MDTALIDHAHTSMINLGSCCLSILIAVVVIMHYLTMAWIPLVAGWGPKGHEIATTIACKSMGTHSTLWARDLLGTADLCEAMNAANSYADDVGKLDGTNELHFVNTPWRKCSSFLLERDCGDPNSSISERKCLVTGIVKYVTELVQDNMRDVQMIAIKMLIHLIADLHQPMHISFAEDRGGNWISLAEPSDMSLHELWDWKLLEDVDTTDALVRMVGYPSSMQRIPLDVLDKASIGLWVAGIVSEVSAGYTCPKAYRDEDWIEVGARLTRGYLEERKRIALELLHVAGMRMKFLFKQIAAVWEDRNRKPHSVVTAADVVPPSNRFGVLTVEDVEFDPEQVAAEWVRGLTKHSKKKKSVTRRSSSCVYDGFDLAPIVLIHDKIHSGHFIVTTSGKDASTGRTLREYTVDFPRNGGSRRSVNLCFDCEVFSRERTDNPDFLIAVVLHLKGMPLRVETTRNVHMGTSGLLGQGSAVLPVVSRVKSFIAAVLTSEAPEGTVYETPSGSQLEVVRGQCAPGLATRERIERKHDLMLEMAKQMFGSTLTPPELEKAYAMHVINQKCANILRVFPEDKSVIMFTTEASLHASNRKAGNPLRVVLYGMAGAGGIRIPMLIDTNLIEAALTVDLRQQIHACAKVRDDIRPTLRDEITELTRWVIARHEGNKEEFQSVIVEQIFAYHHPTIHAPVVEWSRAE